MKQFLNKCLVLTLAALLCLLPLSASAVESIGLSVSAPSPGRGSVSLSWDSVPSAQFYSYSVRDVTTGESIVSNETTSRTSARVSNTWVAGHSYRAWAGACCEGNDPNNNNTWSYTGMTTFTVEGCAHKHTETAWDTDHSIKCKSVSDSEHEVIGYLYEYCTECFEHIGESYKVTEVEPHDFKSNGDCRKCDYTAACPHKHTEYVLISGYPAYKDYNDEEHIVDKQYKEVCSDCDEVLRKRVDEAREYYYEAHNFNSKGVCRQCDFVKPEKQDPLSISVSANQSSVETGATISASATATGGTGSYSYAWKVTCNGGVTAETDLSYGNSYSVKANQAGSYVFTATVQDGNGNQVSASSGKITVKEPPCKHPTTDVAWDSSYSITSVSVSDTEHKTSGYQYRYCTVCFEHIGSSFAATEKVPHNFDSAGDCPTCGYTYKCKHSKTEYVVIDGYPSCKYYNDKEHTIDTQYKEVCLNCGKVVKNVVDSKRTYVHEAHAYNSSGTCTGCGFVKPAEQKELKISVGANQSSAIIGATISANATATGGTGSYSYAWKVTCNGSVIAETDLSYGNYYSVKANQSGSYVFTATVRDGNGNQVSTSSGKITVEKPACQHPTTDVAWDSSYSITSVSVSDTEHKTSGYQYRYCTVCFEHIGSSFAATEKVPHNFDSAGDCPTCGYTHSCKHENTKLVAIDGYPAYHYYNEEEHVYDVQFKEVCTNPSCGKVVRKLVDSARIHEYQKHRFDADGKCSDCHCVKHEVQKPLQVTVSRGQAAAKTGETITASAMVSGGSGIYKYSWKVLLDGAEIFTTTLGTGDSYSWTANKAGTYVFAVTVVDGNNNRVTGSSGGIVVSQSACAHKSYTDMPLKVTYKQISDAKHNKITLINRVCDLCGKTISEFRDEKSENHSFANGVCQECGLADPVFVCKHKHTEEELTGSKITNQGNTNQHIVTETYSVVCQNCGITVRIDEKKTWEDHAFNADGVCDCGYAKPSRVCDHANKVTAIVGTPVYFKHDKKYHSVEAGYKTCCADCGITISETGQEISFELHKYVDGICVCGQPENVHTHHYEKVLVGEPTYTNLNTAEHCVTKTYYKKCAECGDTTGQFTESENVAHTYNDRGHIESKHHDGEGHKTFDRCVCGAAKYTGYALYENCCKCYGHAWQTVEPKEENGEWQRVCGWCGKVEKIEPIEEKVDITGSFSDDAYTMKVGEKLDVPVSTSATNASLTRVTINVDGDSNNRLASKEVSGSSWNGSVQLDGNVTPLNAPGTYTITLFAAVGTGADEWAEVDRAILVVTEADTVPVEEYAHVWDHNGVCTVCGVACPHININYGDHESGHKATCGDCFKVMEQEGTFLSSCDQCTGNGSYDNEKAKAFADICNKTYGVSEQSVANRYSNIIDDGFWSQEIIDAIAEEERRTEILITTEETAEGSLLLTVSFQGSQDMGDWLADLLFTKANEEGIHAAFDGYVQNFCVKTKITVDLMLNGEPVKGEKTIAELLDLVASDSKAHINITGHSMGGSLAQIFTYYAYDEYHVDCDQMTTYTFAALPPFTEKFLDEHRDFCNKNNIFNVIHTKDLAPDVGVVDKEHWTRTAVDLIGEVQGWASDILPVNEVVGLLQNGVISLAGNAGGVNATGGFSVGHAEYMDSLFRNNMVAGQHNVDTYQILIDNYELFRMDNVNDDYMLLAAANELSNHLSKYGFPDAEPGLLGNMGEETSIALGNIFPVITMSEAHRKFFTDAAATLIRLENAKERLVKKIEEGDDKVFDGIFIHTKGSSTCTYGLLHGKDIVKSGSIEYYYCDKLKAKKSPLKFEMANNYSWSYCQQYLGESLEEWIAEQNDLQNQLDALNEILIDVNAVVARFNDRLSAFQKK